MELALSLAALYQIPGLPSGEKTQLATRVRRLADAVLAVRNDKLSNPPNDMLFMWVEQRTMRGWPHYIKDVPTEPAVINHQATCTDPDVFLNNWDKETAQAQCQQNCAFDHTYPFIDAYHNGHVLQVLALAARFAAEAGHHAAAGTYVAGAAEAMYDRYFASREASLLDTGNRVVSVPSDASSDRRRRWMLKTCEFDCHELPQSHNHGAVPATAALFLRDAIALVNWNVATWTLNGVTSDAFRASLKAMVQGSVSLLLGDMKLTGSGARRWKYRANVDSCSGMGPAKDRWEDIAHARYVVDFLAHLYNQNPSNEWGISEALIESILKTFLEELVHPQNNPTKYKDGRRFACDLSGLTDVQSDGTIYTVSQLTIDQEKSCKDSRGVATRVTFATQWSWLAASLQNPSQRCTSLQVVESVFPMLIQTSKHFGKGLHSSSCVRANGNTCNNAGKEAEAASAAIWAKFWFYNYERQLTAVSDVLTGLGCCGILGASATPATSSSSCSGSSRAPSSSSSSTTTTITGSKPCRNKKGDAKCKKKEKKGKCAKKKVKKKCKKACGVC
eukprot:Transcript_22380.p1 GENE.Transcript_22380~~Transcript_22380.p1  ORF type:complete len:560 (-),score=143.62 Transcript_22380:47-1726(-)